MFRFLLSVAVSGACLLAFPLPVWADESRLGVVIGATKSGETRVTFVTPGTVGEFMGLRQDDTILSYTFEKKTTSPVGKPSDMPELLKGATGYYKIKVRGKDNKERWIEGTVAERSERGRTTLYFIRKR